MRLIIKDGHCWIHKSLYTNIYDTVFDENSDTFLKFINQRLNLLKKYKIEIFFVIDGKKPKIKSSTTTDRIIIKQVIREKALKIKNNKNESI